MDESKKTPVFKSPTFAPASRVSSPSSSAPTPVATPTPSLVVTDTAPTEAAEQYHQLGFQQHFPAWRFAMFAAKLPALVTRAEQPGQAILHPNDALLADVLQDLKQIQVQDANKQTPEDYAAFIEVLYQHGLLTIEQLSQVIANLQKFNMLGETAADIPVSIRNILLNSQPHWWRPAINYFSAQVLINDHQDHTKLVVNPKIGQAAQWQKLATALKTAKNSQQRAQALLSSPLRYLDGEDLLAGKEAELAQLPFVTQPEPVHIALHPYTSMAKATSA